MSQFVFVCVGLQASLEIEGFLVRAVASSEALKLLEDLVGGAPSIDGAWVELQPVGGGEFCAFFDAFFQDIDGRDLSGRSFVEILADLCVQAKAVVLSYGQVGMDIDVFHSCDSFVSRVVSDYKEAPVELNAAFVRIPT